MDSNSTRSSISSPVMNSTITEKDHQILSAKYTKLAAEYSKVRAQLGVLKKAVLEEQSKNVSISEEMKVKEQIIRKSEAEMDSLNFRNQQITRRVEILQEELDRKASEHSLGIRKKTSGLDNNAGNASGMHSKVVSGHFHRDTERVTASESLNSVMGEELQLKIAENAKLHAALDGVDKRYEDIIGGLQSRIKELEATMSKNAQAERADDSRLKELVHGLKTENADLTSTVKRLETNLDDEKEKVMILQVQLESSLSVGSSTGAEEKLLEMVNSSETINVNKEKASIAANPSPVSKENVISTTSLPSAQQNHMNPPLTATEARIQTVELLSQVGENIQEIIAAMSDLYTYWEHRIKDTHADGEIWTENSKNLKEHLLENVQYLKPIEQSFQDVLASLLTNQRQQEVATSLTLPSWFSSFAFNFEKYVIYAQRTVEPFIIATLSEESNKISCSSTQQNANDQVQLAFRSFNTTLAELSQLIQIFVDTSSKEKESLSQLEKIELISVKIFELSRDASNLSSLYQAKASDEAELPTVSSSLRNTNQCIVSSTVSLTSGIENLSRKFSIHLPKIGALISANFELISSDLVEEVGHGIENTHSKSNQKEKCTNSDRSNNCDSSYLSLINELNDKVENVKKQKDNLNERLRKSEQEKEHWKVEYQLVQMKHDKLKTHMNDENQETHEHSSDNQLDLGIIVSEDKRIYENRISELVADRLMADSKATNFYLECMALQKRIKFRENNKLTIEKELQNAQDRISNLHEGIGTTNSNYEEQISMLSEHVANMNEKLAEKTEEIQKLQFDLNQKRHKNGKR